MFVDLDINGQSFRVDIEDATARLIVRVGTGPLEVYLDPRSGSGGGGIWYQNTDTEFSTTIDDADVDMTIYYLRYSVFTPRLFTQTTVRRAGDTKFHSRCEPFVVPPGWVSMSADSLEVAGPSEWLLSGTSGPIFDVDAVLFDQIVGGQPFRITATHVGFGDWPDVVVTTVPEPSTIALVVFGAGVLAPFYRIRLGL
jgi:hypothetical protein